MQACKYSNPLKCGAPWRQTNLARLGLAKHYARALSSSWCVGVVSLGERCKPRWASEASFFVWHPLSGWGGPRAHLAPLEWLGGSACSPACTACLPCFVLPVLPALLSLFALPDMPTPQSVAPLGDDLSERSDGVCLYGAPLFQSWLLACLACLDCLASH